MGKSVSTAEPGSLLPAIVECRTSNTKCECNINCLLAAAAGFAVASTSLCCDLLELARSPWRVELIYVCVFVCVCVGGGATDAPPAERKQIIYLSTSVHDERACGTSFVHLVVG